MEDLPGIGDSRIERVLMEICSLMIDDINAQSLSRTS